MTRPPQRPLEHRAPQESELSQPTGARCVDLTGASFDQLAELPEPVTRPRATPCPKARELALDLAIVVEVVVGCDGSVEEVTALNDIGLGCDAVASEMMESARFKPATALDGSPARVTIRWKYVFRNEAPEPNDANP